VYVEDVYRRFVGYSQEPDESWLTPTDIADILADSYSQVRDFVASFYEHAYAEELTGTVPTDAVVDLSDPANAFGQALMGSNALPDNGGNGTLVKILSVERTSTTPGTSRSDYVLDAVHNMDELTQHTYAYLLRDNRIFFGGVQNGDIRLVFERESVVDWTQHAAGSNEYIDNYPETHELIVYYALERYGLKDGDIMKVLDRLVQRQQDKINMWATRTWPKHRRVTRVRRFL
jgi:hypothetical protein